ncbi:MAG: fibronectin type III domain-containing protein [Eubacterium sp.]
MKKLISITMALCIVISSLFTGMFAIAETTKPTTDAVKAQIKGAAEYITADGSAYTVSNAVDFLTVINSGKDVSDYKDGFVKSVKENLDANHAKLMAEKTDWVADEETGEYTSVTTSYESPALYGAVILVLDALGYDAEAFEGYNIVYSFSHVDLKDNQDNPYYYRVTLAGAEKAKLGKDFTKQVCDSFVSTYYKKGKGLDWYGFSCDNTCQFVVAMASYYNDYKEVVDDALALIETYKTDGGYFSNAEYSKDANADSTALALAAYSAMGNIEKAEAVYADLCKFESKTAGIFTYDGEENLYATKDALFGLETFLNSLPECYDGHKYTAKVVAPTCTEDGYTQYTCSVCGSSYKENVIKATGHNFGVNAQKCSICSAANPDYIIPTVTGFAVKSKSTSAIRLIWDKAINVEDYVIYQYNDSTNKYEKIAQVSSTADSYKVSGLKAGTIYKFRISALVDGKEGAKSNYIKATTVPLKGSISSITAPAKKSIKVNLASATCTGYQIQWSTSKDFSTNYKTVTFSASTKTKTIKTAQSKKTYYVRVRAYTKVNGVKVYGKWSTVKSIKTS